MELDELNVTMSEKSRFVAAVLQLFCGCFGLGRFYLGYKTYAILQIITSLLTFGVVGFLWGLADGVLILNGTVCCDGDGKILI